MTSVRSQLLASLRDGDYRHEFVRERVHTSVALQIRALRHQRGNMTQHQLGDAIGMKQTWVSRLEDPDYGKLTVATLLRLARAFDSDLEIKFRPFSEMIDALSTQDSEYFEVPSFDQEFGVEQILAEDLDKVRSIDQLRSGSLNAGHESASSRVSPIPGRAMAAVRLMEQYGNHQGAARQVGMAV